MFTGYYSRLSDYVLDGLIPVSISLYKPSYTRYSLPTCELFVPPKDIFGRWKWRQGDDDYNDACYTAEYKKMVLDPLHINDVKDAMDKLVGIHMDKAILMCYEPPDEFCHRHLVAKWLTRNGIDCWEYDIELERSRKKEQKRVIDLL